ncbi:MAG: hypothetical protein WKG06_37750 [Segetibacter sp.]
MYGKLDKKNVITDVKSSDGRSVHYNYDIYTDSITSWVRLVRVNYGDGTKAAYTYSQSEHWCPPSFRACH